MRGQSLLVQTSNRKMQKKDMSKLYTNLSIQIVDGITFWTYLLLSVICRGNSGSYFKLLRITLQMST